MTVVPVVAGRPHGELRHVEHAELDRARGVQQLQNLRGSLRRRLAQDLGAAGRDYAAAVIHVLVRHRHAVQRSAHVTARELAVGEMRRGERRVVVDAQKTVELGLHRVGAREHRLHRGHAARAPLADRGGELYAREVDQGFHRSSNARSSFVRPVILPGGMRRARTVSRICDACARIRSSVSSLTPLGASARPASVGFSAWQLTQRCSTMRFTSSSLIGSRFACGRGASATMTTPTSSKPATSVHAGAAPLWRPTNQRRTSAPASAMAISTSQFHACPKVMAWWFEIMVKMTGSVKYVLCTLRCLPASAYFASGSRPSCFARTSSR